MPTPITYLELPSTDVATDKHFYNTLFGWTFEDFGPEYAAFSNSGIKGGFNGGGDHQPKAPLPVLLTDDLEAMLHNVSAPEEPLRCPSSPSPEAAASTSPTPLETNWQSCKPTDLSPLPDPPHPELL